MDWVPEVTTLQGPNPLETTVSGFRCRFHGALFRRAAAVWSTLARGGAHILTMWAPPRFVCTTRARRRHLSVAHGDAARSPDRPPAAAEGAPAVHVSRKRDPWGRPPSERGKRT